MTRDAPVKVALSLRASLTADMLTERPPPDEVSHSLEIHNQTIAAANSFHSLFAERQKAGKDADDHYEQDLLRAMLVFACSGLDATVKQLVRDSLQRVIDLDVGAQGQFAKFIERRLKRSAGDDTASPQLTLDYTLLSTTLASPEPRAALINNLKRALTNDSLQSRDQLLRVAGHFALTQAEVLVEDGTTKAAFDARNQIAHEMDIDFRAGARRHRVYNDMVLWTENILQVSAKFIGSVSTKLETAA